MTTLSQQIALINPASAVTPQNAQWNLLVKWAGFSEPKKVDLSVLPVTDALPGTSTPSFPVPLIEGYCGQRDSTGSIVWEPWLAAAFRITWGSGAMQKRIVCDLRTATVYLGACESVSIECMRWRTINWPAFGAIFPPTVIASAALSEGMDGAPPYRQELTATVVRYLQPFVNYFGGSMYIPTGAASWEPVYYDLFRPLWGSGNPIYRWYGFGGLDLAIDPAVGLTPSNFTRQGIMSRTSGWFGDITQPAAVLTTGAVWLGTRFYLSI